MEDRKQRLIEVLEEQVTIMEDNPLAHQIQRTVLDYKAFVKWLKVGVIPMNSSLYYEFIEDPETFYSDYLN